MILLIIAATGLALEGASMSMALQTTGSDHIWTIMLLQHAAASVMLAALMWYLMPDRFRRPHLPIMLLLFNFSFFIPFFGLAGVWLAVLISRFRHRRVIAQPFASVALPEFVLSLREPEARFSNVGIRARLAHPSIPTPLRLQSLLALQDMPLRVSSPLLQNLLGDASDDIRLVAYGLLDSREKKITARIHQELGNLKAAGGRDLRLRCLRQLAELYWELTYSGLARDDLRTHALQQALACANDALKLAPRESGLWLLKGRILHAMKNDEEASRMLERAMALGLPESRVLPYMVEILFDRGERQRVRSLLARISVSQVTPVMKNIIRLWAHRTGPTFNHAIAAEAV